MKQLMFSLADRAKKRMGRRVQIGCLVLIAMLVILVMIPYFDLYIGLLRISLRTGIRPSVSALEAYLDTSLTPGMSRDAVNQMLYSIGTQVKILNFDHEDEICDSIGLYVGYWPLNRLEYLICYDKETILSLWTARPC
jgi:hypothetical protein